jgi:hypothetical protein
MSMPVATPTRPVPVPLRERGAAPTPSGADGFAGLINLAGRQRMLSQRIVLFCVLAAQGDSQALTTAQEALTLFRDSHARLLHSRLALEGEAAQALQAAFFGARGADRPVGEFMRLAEETLNAVAQALPTLKRLLPSLVARTTPVLQLLNELTQVYEAQGRRAMQAGRQQQAALMQEIGRIAGEARLASLNARVAAARAGDAGREFAVVAGTLSGISEQIESLSRAAMAASG